MPIENTPSTANTSRSDTVLFTPNQIGQLIDYRNSPRILTISVFIIFIVSVFIWASLYEIPEAINSQGILYLPGAIQAIQSDLTTGIVSETSVQPGDYVQPGDLVAKVQMPTVEFQLKAAKAKLVQLQGIDSQLRGVEENRLVQFREFATTQDLAFRNILKNAELAYADSLKEFSQLDAEILKLNQSQRTETENSKAILIERITRTRILVNSKLLKIDQLNFLEDKLLDVQALLSTIDAKIAEFRIRELEWRQSLLVQKQTMIDLQSKIQQLQLDQVNLDQQILQLRTSREIAQTEQLDRIHALEEQIREQGSIISPFAGRVLEFNLVPGQSIQPGYTVATVNVQPDIIDPRLLKHLAIFPVSSGKRIQPGMEVQLSPSTIQRTRFGYIRGTVTHVSPYPVSSESLISTIGNREFVSEFVPNGGMIVAEIEIDRTYNPNIFEANSQVPKNSLTNGTKTQTRIVLSKRTPVSYLFSGFRELLGDRDNFDQ